MNKEVEIVRRLVPITGFIDDKTGLLYVQTPTSNFDDFIKLIEANDKDLFNWTDVSEDEEVINVLDDEDENE